MGCCNSSQEKVETASFERAQPVLDFDCKTFEYGGVSVTRCAVQGWRKSMEDVALVQYGVSPRKDTLALGVFDGHSGGGAARFAQEKLLGHIESTEEWRRGDISAGCIKGFIAADAAMRTSGVDSGTTAVLALVTPEEITVANCGDSRSVLSRGGRQLPMSVDHKPGRKGESRRILRSGGYLDRTDPQNPRVICDSLNVRMSIATSRALGDFDFKSNPSKQPGEQMISPVPEFYTRQRTPDDEFLVLASDGVWDVMDNPGIVVFLKNEADAHDLREKHKAASVGRAVHDDDAAGAPGSGGDSSVKPVEALARAVLQRCLDLGSRDNMTIVLADLRPRKEPPEVMSAPAAKALEATAVGKVEGGEGGYDSSASGVDRGSVPGKATPAPEAAPATGGDGTGFGVAEHEEGEIVQVSTPDEATPTAQATPSSAQGVREEESGRSVGQLGEGGEGVSSGFGRSGSGQEEGRSDGIIPGLIAKVWSVLPGADGGNTRDAGLAEKEAGVKDTTGGSERTAAAAETTDGLHGEVDTRSCAVRSSENADGGGYGDGGDRGSI